MPLAGLVYFKAELFITFGLDDIFGLGITNRPLYRLSDFDIQ